MKKEIYQHGILFLLLIVFSGCNKWLDVKPEDKFIEEQLYSNPQGFADALNSFYIKNGNESSYGGDLTMITMDVLAQLYAVNSLNTQNNVNLFSTYNYGDVEARKKIDGIWTATYVNIANANKFLESLGTYGSRLDPKMRDLYEGEVYGLRAFYYFDLMRMFTKTYTSLDSLSKTLPYYDKVGKEISEFQPNNFMMQKVLEDLNKAEQLLLKNDPAVTQNRVSLTTTSTGRTSRNYRMNYYAVRALKARVYLWKGDKMAALKEAKFLIDNQSKFPWIAITDLNNPAATNKIFSTELILAVENPKLNDLFNRVFNPTLFDDRILAGNTSGTFVKNTVFEGVEGDYRYQFIWKVAGKTYPTFFKYQDVPTETYAANRTVPLIRMSEMYLIAAECETDLPAAIGYLNQLRIHRNQAAVASTTTSTQLSTHILKEYRREFYGEGQLFFYYKRTKASSIVAALTNSNMSIPANNYVFPIPLSETDPR